MLPVGSLGVSLGRSLGVPCDAWESCGVPLGSLGAPLGSLAAPWGAWVSFGVTLGCLGMVLGRLGARLGVLVEGIGLPRAPAFGTPSRCYNDLHIKKMLFCKKSNEVTPFVVPRGETETFYLEEIKGFSLFSFYPNKGFQFQLQPLPSMIVKF